MVLKLLDLYCGAGGCSVGYSRSGFQCMGIDKYFQNRYPFEFVQADALDVLRDIEFCRQFDLIHASPVCKGYSTLSSLHKDQVYDDDIPEVRYWLKRIGKPYVIENVPGSPLRDYVVLCGSMFGLKVKRHRLFECNPSIWFPPYACNCKGMRPLLVAGHSGAKPARFGYLLDTVENRRRAMGIDWMVGSEIRQAIPPAYTEYIGRFMRGMLV